MYGPPWRWRWGRRGRGRPPKHRIISIEMRYVTFIPLDERGLPISNEPIYIMPDELEALRLVYLENLTQEEAARRMGVSRGTLWRTLSSGRKKITQALVEKRPIILSR
ncbi:hypothetical protein DRJ17_06645 [Candidatus Woesearchaeota archaeon]|nr:MAG: hypothetical protein DRJ17_06645 [Candidatus Woesearchaeota archaeon]